MQLDKNKNHIRDLIASSKNIVVICSDVSVDCVAAGVSLAKYIEDVFNKHPSVVYTGDMSRIPVDLLKIRKLGTDFESKILKVILNYKDTQIETLDYYKEEDSSRLILEISPVERNFDLGRIRYEFEGTDYDLIIVIGASRLKDLGNLYHDNKKDFNRASIINVDISGDNENFGKINIVDVNYSSISSLLFKKYYDWGYVPNQEVSKSLLIGLSGEIHAD